MSKRNANFSISNSAAISIVLVFVILGAGLAAAMIYGGHNGNTQIARTTSSSSSQNIDGVVTGYLTVEPSWPLCSQNKSCTVNLADYSLIFKSQCSNASCQVQTFLAPVSPSGHYSVLLPAGNYVVSGLSPSCIWIGCSTAFPKTIVVQGGMQLVVNVDIGR
jgi:hypothetical protein